MAASDEQKPSLPSSHITLKVQSQDNVHMMVRIKKDSELRMVMEAFSMQVGKEMTALEFLFDGTRIKPNQTPNELELQDGDEIDAFQHVIGGGFSFCHRY